ncbi:MAG: hypothetical protein M0Z66_07305 [Thermaerobacter sp.]|nr:hypothetical protein [Thermaerobacter sp.]
MYVSGHRKNDVYSLRLHLAIASKLRADPDAVLRTAMRNLTGLRNRPNESYYVREWERLLRGPLDELLSMMVQDSEYATALRQATPFTGILKPQETWEIQRAVAEEWRHAAR